MTKTRLQNQFNGSDPATDRQQGSVIVMVIIIAAVFTAIGIALLDYTISQRVLAHRNVTNANAILAAEAGIEQTLHQLNQDDDFAGYTSEQEFFDNDKQGYGTYQSTIEDAEDSNSKIITSTGRVYRHSNDSNPSVRKVRVTVVGTNSEGYSVHSGPGGLILGGSANITNSDVYVNGTLTLNGAARIGTSSQPLNVNVANIACPAGGNPGPSYPELCTSSEPISMAHSTSIYGTVCATGQTSTGPNNNIKPGNGGEGLKPGCVAPPVSPPTYDRDGHIDDVNVTGQGNSNAYTCQSWPFDRTWPADLQLNGDVNIGGACNITINGNAYITGDLTIGGASRITVADSVGETQPVVIVDGDISVDGSAQMITNSSGTGIHFISFKSAASCSPDCTSLSGNDLKASQNLLTVDVGGAVNLPGMIFHAFWGKVRVAGSGSVGAAAGQTIDMSGAGTVVFGTELSAGSKTWTITGYQRIVE